MLFYLVVDLSLAEAADRTVIINTLVDGFDLELVSAVPIIKWLTDETTVINWRIGVTSSPKRGQRKRGESLISTVFAIAQF